MSAIQADAVADETGAVCRVSHPTHPWWRCTLTRDHSGAHTAERHGGRPFAIWEGE